GGRRWAREGRPVTTDPPRPPPPVSTPRAQPGWRVGTAEVRAAMGNGTAALVDCRHPREFAGEIGRGERKGRIASAVHVPVTRFFNAADRTWKNPPEIRKVFGAA